MLEGRTGQNVLCKCLQHVFCNDEITAILKSFLGFVQIFFKRTAWLLKRLSFGRLSGSCHASQVERCVKAVSGTERTHFGGISPESLSSGTAR